MHAANLLNKRRQQREEQIHPKVSPLEHRDSQHHRVTKKTNSQTSFLDSIGAGASTPTSSSVPRIPTVYEPSYRSPPVLRSKQGTSHGQVRNGASIDGYYGADPVILYHKPERISCAHIGLGIMIIGTIVTIIAGFVCYLLGFGEPGVIIGCGGGAITVVSLLLLCCGNRWHLDERIFGKKIPLNFVRTDMESGTVRRPCDERVGDTLEVCKIPKPTLPSDPYRMTVTPVFEIDMVSDPDPSGGTVETEAEEVK